MADQKEQAIKPLKVEYVKIDSLAPYPFNNKVHTAKQISDIAISIKRFGFNQPIVIDKDSVIVAGHGRLEAAKKLGYKEVPVVRVSELTESEIKAYRILDNKVSADTGYDFENLKIEVRSLEDAGLDTKEFSFDEFKFDEPAPPPPEKNDEPAGQWVGQIKLKVPADQIDHFEAELADLVAKYPGISKETKRVK